MKVKKYWLKACPKCHGDMALSQDIHGWFVQCMQCGTLKELRRAVQHPTLADMASVRLNGHAA